MFLLSVVPYMASMTQQQQLTFQKDHDCKSKWKSIRSSYIRTLNSRSKSDSTKEYYVNTNNTNIRNANNSEADDTQEPEPTNYIFVAEKITEINLRKLIRVHRRVLYLLCHLQPHEET